MQSLVQHFPSFDLSRISTRDPILPYPDLRVFGPASRPVAREACYPSPPMSGSPSPENRSKQRSRQDDFRYASNIAQSDGTDSRRESNSTVGGSHELTLPSLQYGRREESSSSSHVLLPVLQQQPPPSSSGLPSLPSLSSYEGRQTNAAARPGARTDPFLYRSQSSLSNEGPRSIPSPTTGNTFAPRPTRKQKAHVTSACVNCKRAHLSCDDARPCTRCTNTGKQDTCEDVPHKKRGRPRLHDERNTASERDAGEPQPPLIMQQQQLENLGSRIPDMQSQPGSSMQVMGGVPSASMSSQPSRSQTPAVYAPSAVSTPVAFLDEDFVVVRMNRAFFDAFAFGEDLIGRSVEDLVYNHCHKDLSSIRREILDERHARDPSYSARGPGGRAIVIPPVEEINVERATEGFADRLTLLEFRRAAGLYRSLGARFRLARTNVYFITLVVSMDSSWPAIPSFVRQSPGRMLLPAITSAPSAPRPPGQLPQLPQLSQRTLHTIKPPTSILPAYTPPLQSPAGITPYSMPPSPHSDGPYYTVQPAQDYAHGGPPSSIVRYSAPNERRHSNDPYSLPRQHSQLPPLVNPSQPSYFPTPPLPANRPDVRQDETSPSHSVAEGSQSIKRRRGNSNIHYMID